MRCEMISRHYQEDYGVEVDPSRIFVTAGGSGALLLAVTYLLDADDEIIFEIQVTLVIVIS